MANDSDRLPKIDLLFVEAQQWEREQLTKHCRQCANPCVPHAYSERLKELDDERIPEGLTVLSPFIHDRIGPEQLDRMPALELIATRSTGHDHIDLDECNRRGILVSNVPRYGENTVAEHTIALLLALTRKIHRSYERTVRGDFSIEGLRGTDLFGKTFGCLGTGAIARRVLRIARGFGMRLIAYDIKPDEELAAELGFEYVSFDRLLAEAQVLSVHVPYNQHTHHLIDAEALAKLPEGAIVVNTARGGIVDPQALLEALQSGHLGGAALDVLEAESAVQEEVEILSSEYDVETLRALVRNHTLLRMPNVIITPHVAFNSEEALGRIIDTTVRNIQAFRRGEPQNVVNRPAGTPATRS